MKKITTLILVLTAVLCLFVAIDSFAATSGNFTYYVSNGSVTITDCDPSVSGDIIIPSTLGGYPVTSIGYSAFSSCRDLTSITIPDSVTSIEDEAFYGCISLTSITIPDGVTSIGSYAFADCDGLTSITIPDSVTSIGSYAFRGCSSLTSITIPDSVTSIGDYAFSGCDNVAEVITPSVFATLPNNIRKLTLTKTTQTSVSTLENYKNIQEVILTNNITSIGGSAFEGCSGLTNIVIPDSVTSIEKSAFADCDGLTSITIPDSVTSIGSYAFRGCSSLTSITIPDSVTSIGSYAFRGCSSLTSIAIPDSVTYISEGAFYNCSSLKSITIPDGVTSIGAFAFEFCGGLTSITIPDSVTSIGSYAFRYCRKLKSITIPDSVTSIGESAFEDCSGLTSITAPNNVISIGGGAFYGCNALEEITLPFIGSQRGNSGNADATFKYIFRYYSNSEYWYRVPASLKKVTITDETFIGTSAFEGCSGLTSITIPASVTSIGEGAFTDCDGLTSIVIPNSVTFIGSGVFNECNNLTKISIPFVGSSADSIGKEALFGYIFGETPFSGAYAASQVYDTIGSVATFYIPSKLTMIDVTKATKVEYGAFNNCMNVSRIRFADGLNTVGRYAFAGCDMLSEIYLPDTITSIGSYAFDNSINVTIYAPEGSYVNTYAERNNIPFIASNGDILVANKTVSDNEIIVKAYLPHGVSNNTVFVSCYDENDILIQAVGKVNYIDGQEISLINQKSINYIKVYLWDSLQSMKPLAGEVKLDM